MLKYNFIKLLLMCTEMIKIAYHSHRKSMKFFYIFF